MTATTKIAAGVASGYLLGRMKKLRLAVMVGSLLAGQRIATNPQALLAQGQKLAEQSPELQRLQEQVRDRLVEAAKGAAVASATQRLELMTRSLRGDEQGDDEYEDDGDYEDEPEDEEYDEEPEEEEPEDEEPEEEEPEEEPQRRPRKRASSAGRRAPAKKSSSARKASSSSRSGSSTTKKAPAKPAPRKKSA